MSLRELKARVTGRVRKGRDPETGEAIMNYQDDEGRWYRKDRHPETGKKARIYTDEDLREYTLEVDSISLEEVRHYFEPEEPVQKDRRGRKYRMGRNPATGERVKRYL